MRELKKYPSVLWVIAKGLLIIVCFVVTMALATTIAFMLK